MKFTQILALFYLMDPQEYLYRKKKFQRIFLDFLNNEENSEEDFDELIKISNDNNIGTDLNEFRLFLFFILLKTFLIIITEPSTFSAKSKKFF